MITHCFSHPLRISFSISSVITPCLGKYLPIFSLTQYGVCPSSAHVSFFSSKNLYLYLSTLIYLGDSPLPDHGSLSNNSSTCCSCCNSFKSKVKIHGLRSILPVTLAIHSCQSNR